MLSNAIKSAKATHVKSSQDTASPGFLFTSPVIYHIFHQLFNCIFFFDMHEYLSIYFVIYYFILYMKPQKRDSDVYVYTSTSVCHQTKIVHILKMGHVVRNVL